MPGWPNPASATPLLTSRLVNDSEKCCCYSLSIKWADENNTTQIKLAQSPQIIHPNDQFEYQLTPVTMSIFSRIKRARKAAAEHKKVVAQVEESKPPPVPYKHIPTHAAHDALAANPTRWTHEETMTRIAEAKQRISVRVPSAPPALQHARANSDNTFRAHHVLRRAHSDLSIDSVMQRPVPPFTATKAMTRNYEVPLRLHNDETTSPLKHHAFPTPHNAPVPQPQETRAYYHRSTTSKSSIPRQRSPLSIVSTGNGMSFNSRCVRV